MVAETTPWADAPPLGLVDLRAERPGACFDVRYATADNFTGAPLPGYEVPGAWLRADAALALKKAQTELAEHGRGLLVFDGYRPARAGTAMAAWARDHGRGDLLREGYVASRSRHATGTTIDVGLCDLQTHAPVDMGTDFDEFSEAAHHRGGRGEPAAARRQLRAAMRRAGFSPYAREWWHYTFAGAVDPTSLDIPYASAATPTAR